MLQLVKTCHNPVREGNETKSKETAVDSPQAGHICLALHIKNNVDGTDPFFVRRGRRLSEITNISVCSCFNLVSRFKAGNHKIVKSMYLYLHVYNPKIPQ